MSYLYLKASELIPRDAVHIYDEESGKYVTARVASIDDGVIRFTDGGIVKIYNPNSTVKVSRLQLIKGGDNGTVSTLESDEKFE